MAGISLSLSLSNIFTHSSSLSHFHSCSHGWKSRVLLSHFRSNCLSYGLTFSLTFTYTHIFTHSSSLSLSYSFVHSLSLKRDSHLRNSILSLSLRHSRSLSTFTFPHSPSLWHPSFHNIQKKKIQNTKRV